MGLRIETLKQKEIMPLDNEKLKKVYSTLKEGGYDQDYNTFVKGFSGNENYGKRKQVYDLLSQNGAQVGKNYADFMQRLYTPSPKQTQVQQPRVNRGSMMRAVTDPLNARGIGGVMQNINKVQGVVKKAEKEKANGYQPRFDGVTKRNTEAKIPTLADMKPMTTFEPTPHFETEKSVDADGKIVSKAKPKQIFDGSGQPKYVYQDSFTGKTYDPNDSDPHTQEMIKRGKDAAYYVQETRMPKVAENDLNGLASVIDKRMLEIENGYNEKAREDAYGISGWDIARGDGALISGWKSSMDKSLAGDMEYQILSIARKSLSNAHEMIEEAEKSKREGSFEGFIKGAGRGFVNGVFDPETWNFGASSLKEAMGMEAVLYKFDNGQKLTKAEQTMLDAKAMEMAVNAFYGSDLGRGYKAGKVTAEAIPFMIEMAINPASGAGKGAASMLTRYALKRFGKKGLVKASKKAAEKAFVRAEERALAKGLSKSAAKAAGERAAARATTQTIKFQAAKTGARVLGDIAGASTMAATTGAMRTAADAVSRHSGDVKFDVNDKGNIVFAGHDKGDDWWTAVKKAFANTAIENYSELFGAYFAPIGSFVGKAGEKLLSKLGLDKVTEMLGKLSSSDIAKAIKRIEEKGQFNGVIGEDLEEQVGGIMNALIVGDQTLDTADGTGVFNTDNQIDTILGVSLMGGIFSAARLGGGLVGGQGNLEARRAVRQAGVAALKDFKGKELIWDKIKSDVDNASNDQLEHVVKNIVTDGGLSDENKKAALQYVRSSMHLRGFEAIRPLTKEEEEADAHNVQEEAVHNRGFEADAQERKDIAIESADPDNAEAQQAWAGVEQRIDDDATRMADAFREKALQMQHNDGSFHTATLKEKDEHGEGKQVFIVSGHVQMTPDGTMIDREASDKTIVIFDPSTGERKMIDPSSDFGLSSVDEPTTPEELEASIERERQGFIQAQLDDARGTIRLSVGQQFVLPDGNEAVVVALDESGEDITAMLADGTQVNIQRAELQQAHDDQALAEYRQRKGNEEPMTEDEATEQSEQGAQVVQIEGAPSSYEPDMELVVRNENGGESQAIVMGRVRYEGGEFVPDENGGIVEYFMDGEVRHEQIGKLNDRVVAYAEAAQVSEEEAPAAEDTQAADEGPMQEEEDVQAEDEESAASEEEDTTPLNEEEVPAEEEEAMPMRDNGEEDWEATSPERAHTYIYNEAGLSQREGNEFVAAQKDAAQRALNKAKSTQAPKVGTSIRQYNEAKAKHQEKIENAQRVLDYWNAVQDIQVAIQHKEREQKEAEDAKAHEEAKAQMQAEFEARKAARAEAMERRKAESLQEDGDSGTSIVGVQDGAEQIPVLKEDEDLQGKGKNSPDRNKPQSRIQSFIDEWERLKKEGDAEALDHFSRTINIALNGYAQARGVEEEFKQLRAEIDEYAKAYNERVREKRKANSANDSAENKETPTDFTPSPRKDGEDVIEDIQAGDGYSITPTTYTNKKGKTTPMHLVRFGRELSKEEIRAGKEIAKESRGWWDSKQGGFMMRSEEAAKALAESLSNEEAVQDAQPLSVEDMAAVTDHALVQAVDDAIKVEKKEQPTVQYDYDREEEVYDKVLSGLRDALNNNVGSIPNIKAIEKQIRDLRRRIKTVENGLATTSADNVAQGFDALALLTGRVKAYEQFLSDLRKKMRETERDDALAAHGVKLGDKIIYKGKEATIHDADERQVKLDIGLAPVLYEVADWENVDLPKSEEHTEQPKQEEKKAKSKWVDDEDAERFEELRKRLKQKLRGQLNMGVDPEILTIGIEMSYLVLKNGARKFKDFAEQLLGAVGEEVRPYLKAFYNGARDLPEMEDYAKELTPYDEVRTFDVKNFDKEGAKDIVDTAEYIVREQEAERDAKKVSNKLKEERNEQRKESEQQIATNTTSTTSNLKGRYMSEADIEGAFKKTFVDKETGAELTVGKFTSPHKVAVKINGDVSIVEWRHLANMLNEGKWQEKTSHDLHDSNIEDNVIVKSHDEVNGEKVGTQEENTSKESGKDKKDVSLQQPTSHIIDGLFDDDIRQKQNERNDGSRESHSSIGTRREELSSSDKVGTGASVQDPARDSQGQRRRLGISSTESRTRPQYDVNRKYSNEEINDIVSSVTEIRDGKVVITDNVSDDIRAIARQYVSGGIAKDGRGVLDEYYTDGEIVDAVASLIAPLLPKGRRLRVLEPSVGVGNFIAAVPKSSTSTVVTFEINETTARIAKILHPDIEVNVRSFETEFIDDEGNKKPVRSEYDVVIGNPPYGAHRGMYKGLGEESKIARYEDYFVKRSLDVLSDGGVLAMVLPSSWLDRQKQAKGYNVVRAYRLPSGAFAGTKIGTDIVVLRKKDSATPTDVSRYFDAHPERVLGVEKERKGRFGRQERYIDGDIDTALSAIQRDDAIDVAKELGLPHDTDTLNDVESAIEEAGSVDGGKSIVQAEEKEKRAEKGETPKKRSSNGVGNGIKLTLKKGGEIVPASVHFQTTFSESEIEAFKDTYYDGTIENWKDHIEHVSYHNGSYLNDFYYAEGDIYARLAQLEHDKDYIVNTHGQAQYEKQRSMLERVLPKPKGIDEISITPNTSFVHNLRIGGEHSLERMFLDFIHELPHEAFGGSSAWEVGGYVRNEQVYGNDKHHNQLVRDRRKKVGDALFKRFLKEELSESMRGIVLNAFNREYNGTYRPDYSQVPMFSQLRKEFHGKTLKLTNVQLAGVGRSTVKGVGVLAHEVGFGKTLSGVLAMQEAMTRGNARKPLIVVPNDNIMHQWIETIEEVVPEAIVNVLGNLGTKYDLTDFVVNDGEYSIVTYEGLKAMSFSDKTYGELANNFSYITDELEAHKSQRDIEKAKAKHQELAGKMKRGSKKNYSFEDFGFDYLTFDEVHNANHIVGKVKLDSSEYSDFRAQNQRPSDLGIKTWMAAQYIQEHNNGRNVLLLSATPFTNKPLEYYSILSLVANDMLKRKGFYKIDEFFKTFMEADNELEINAAGKPVRKTNVRRFRNNGLFQSLLGEYIDIKGEDDNPDLVRPDRHNKEYKLPQNELTQKAMDSVQDMLANSDTLLQGIGSARQVAFSPYSVFGIPNDYKTFVENSPKIDATMKLIKQNKKDLSDAGQIIYSEVCVDTFPLIKEYLVREIGYKDSEVRTITGATSNAERLKIQEAFNTGDVKVVIGSPAIKEGLNLQGNTTDMYILSLPWNFTQLRQIEGRGWRQGNRWKNIRINYMLTEDSADVFMLQRLQTKQGLYNEAMKKGVESVDVSDIDTTELKAALIKNPATRADIIVQEEFARLNDEKIRLESEASFVERKCKDYKELDERRKSLERLIAREKKDTDSFLVQSLTSSLESVNIKIEQEREKLREKGVDLESVDEKLSVINERVDDIKKKMSKESRDARMEQLTAQFTNEAELHANGATVDDYIKERAKENAAGYYELRKTESEEEAGKSEDVRFRQGEGAARELKEVNERFNEELQKQIDGTLPAGHIYQLGSPGEILLSTGIPNLPIQMSAKKLSDKATSYGHNFDLSEVKDLVNVLQHPLALFSYGDKNKAQNVIVSLQKDGNNFIIGLSLNPSVGGHKLEVNSIRNVFPKKNAEWLNWISQGKALYIDKEKVQNLIDQQRTILADVDYLDLDSVANILKDFENPTIEGKNQTALSENILPTEALRDRKAMRNEAEQLAEKLHTPVNVVEDANEITHPNKEIEARRRKAKGWYNVSTGEVVVVLANHKDAADVAATICHEVIAHKGLRELVGEAHYDEFLDEVYDHLSGDLKREIDDAAGRALLNDINKSGDDVRDYKRHRRIAVDELFGSLAEKPFEEFSENERSLWQQIKEFAKKLLDRFLDKLKLPKWFELGDNELRYILWRSKERLERGKEDPIDQARDIVKREELGLTNEPLNKVSVTARNFDELAERNEWNPKPIRGEEMVDLYDIAPKVTTHDYYLGTKADFKLVKSAENVRDAWEKLKQQDGFRYEHSPKSDSEYLVNDKTGEIYRISDHWGWVASCRWSIDDQAPSGFSIGKANIKDFERIKGNYVFTPEAQRREPGHETYLRAKENLERALKDDTYKFTAAARRLAEEKVRSHQSNAEFYEQNHESGDIVYRRNEFGKYIPYRELKHSREQWFEGYISEEEREIVERAQADGSYMKAPNGKPSNLNGKQWAQVRTKAFKKWFGDWEKAARIEKLRKSEPVVISGNEYKGKYELNRDSAKAWIKENLRGEYTVADTGEKVVLTKVGANKVTSHGMNNKAHLQSIAIIPQLIRHAIFVEERPNEKSNNKYDSYRYYVCGLKIGTADYTVKLTIGVKSGKKYYDHALTEIEKGKLLDQINDQAAQKGFTTTGDAPLQSYALSIGKDTKLVSILQGNSSKVVDENGEPQVIRSVEEKKRKRYFLNIRHPLEVPEDVVVSEIADKAVKEGYDGVHTPKGYIPFTVNQYKSAQRNNGEFSTESDDVLYRDSGETRDIWLDQSMGLQERTTAAAARLANNHRDNKVFMQDAMRAIGANLTDLRKAMRLQKDFDRTTAKRVYDLARILMEMGYLRGLNQQEVSKLLSVMKNSIGKQNIDNDVQQLMDLMVNHQLKQSKSTLESLEHIKGSKVNAKGVEVQGALDAEGQAIMAAMKAAKDIVTPCAGKTEEDNGELTAWGQALEDVQERIGSEDNAIAENAALEYQGMLLAQQWFDEIKQRELEEASLRQELNHAQSTTPAEERKGEAYKEYIGNLKQAIQQNKIDRAQAYMNLVGRLTESLRESIEGAKAFKLREKARISAIQRDANLDMEGRPAGEHYVPDWKARAVNNGFVSCVAAPLATMDQMLRLFGNKSANGEGYLYNRFERGFIDARQQEIKGYREKTAILDAKAAEIFGGKIKTWADLIRYVSGLPDKEVVFKNDGIDERFTLSQGNLMYIYMVNKMLDGRLKLSKMGLTSDVVEELAKEIDPRLIKLADWMQEDFLVQTRNEYNETHKRVFGASMAAIENYFPLKIRSNARIDKAEDLDNPTRNNGISTTTGSIIKRRRNSLPLDLLNADALNIILSHITEMEHWNAFVEYNRDLNTLRTYKRFRNGVENMTTIYGSGKELWKLFNDLCQITTGSYIPPRENLDKSLVNLAKGVTAAKVSFRLFTALKQFLSFPAYFPEVRAVHIAKCLAHPKESWDWCMENLPIFNERWNSRLSGDPRLLKTNMDWKMWRTRAAEIAMRIGMTPNAFVDALTVCIGARAMYMTRKGQYLRDGYTEEVADKKAKQDAETLYNQTQQSSEGAFLSRMQVDRGWLSVLFSIFRNSSMAYTRQVYDAMRNLRRNLTPGGRKESIAFMTKQYMNEGFDKAKAEENAKRKFDRQIRKDILRVATFGYLLQFAWNLGAYLFYMLFGGDDDEKEVFWQDVFAHSYFGSLEGLTGGDVISMVLGSYVAGNLNPSSMDKDMPLTSDLAVVVKEFAKGDKDAALSDMINLIVQSGIGVNPQSITDSVLAIMDACGDDPALANEATIFIARILQVPQSQIDKLYFDEVGLMGSGLSKYTPAQLAERYARYKVKRGHFSTPWAWNDDVNIGKAMTKANREIKARTNHMGLTNLNEAFVPYEEVYQKVDKQMEAYEAAKKTDYVKAANMMVEIQKDKASLDIYRKFKSMDSQLDKMAKRFLSAKSNGERQLYRKMIESYKPAMLKVLQAKGEAAQEKAMDDIGTLMEGFAEEQEKLYENQ